MKLSHFASKVVGAFFLLIANQALAAGTVSGITVVNARIVAVDSRQPLVILTTDTNITALCTPSTVNSLVNQDRFRLTVPFGQAFSDSAIRNSLAAMLASVPVSFIVSAAGTVNCASVLPSVASVLICAPGTTNCAY